MKKDEREEDEEKLKELPKLLLWRLTTLFFSRIFSEWSWMMILRAVSFGIISAIGGDLSAFREIKRQW